MPTLSDSLPSLSDTESVYQEDTLSHEDETINLSIVTQLYDTRCDHESGRFTETPNETSGYLYDVAMIHADILNMMSDEISRSDPGWSQVAINIGCYVRYAELLLPWYIEKEKSREKIAWATDMVATLEKKFDEMMARKEESRAPSPIIVAPRSHSCPALHTFVVY